mgnify:CR=1 FL=1
MGPRFLIMMSRWARNPPSPRKTLVIAAIVGIALAAAVVEWTIGWPDALTVEPRGNRIVR